MFIELCKRKYEYLIHSEILLFRFYKVDPFLMEERMTMLDFEMFIKQLIKYTEEDRKQKTSDKLMKSLIAIRDTLNYMTLTQ